MKADLAKAATAAVAVKDETDRDLLLAVVDELREHRRDCGPFDEDGRPYVMQRRPGATFAKALAATDGGPPTYEQACEGIENMARQSGFDSGAAEAHATLLDKVGGHALTTLQHLATERDEARRELRALVAGLSKEDAPRLEAVKRAQAVVAAWGPQR